MGKQGKTQIVAIIVIAVILLFFAGIIKVEDGQIVIPGLTPSKYMQIEAKTNISNYETLQINVLVNNPKDQMINPELEVIYNSNWRTTNRYLISNNRIPIGLISPGNLQKYSVEFNPDYSLKGKTTTFKFILYVDNKTVDTKEIQVNVN